MKCADAKKMIYDYTKREKLETKNLKLEEHLSKCKSCEKEYLEIIALKNLFKVEEQKVPSSILKAVKSSIKAKQSFADIIFKPLTITVSLSLVFMVGIFSLNNKPADTISNEYVSFFENMYDLSSIASDITQNQAQNEESGLIVLSDIYEY